MAHSLVSVSDVATVRCT